MEKQDKDPLKPIHVGALGMLSRGSIRQLFQPPACRTTRRRPIKNTAIQKRIQHCFCITKGRKWLSVQLFFWIQKKCVYWCPHYVGSHVQRILSNSTVEATEKRSSAVACIDADSWLVTIPSIVVVAKRGLKYKQNRKGIAGKACFGGTCETIYFRLS